jgi:hypothetical protein
MQSMFSPGSDQAKYSRVEVEMTGVGFDGDDDDGVLDGDSDLNDGDFSGHSVSDSSGSSDSPVWLQACKKFVCLLPLAVLAAYGVTSVFFSVPSSPSSTPRSETSFLSYTENHLWQPKRSRACHGLTDVECFKKFVNARVKASPPPSIPFFDVKLYTSRRKRYPVGKGKQF